MGIVFENEYMFLEEQFFCEQWCCSENKRKIDKRLGSFQKIKKINLSSFLNKRKNKNLRLKIVITILIFYEQFLNRSID